MIYAVNIEKKRTIGQVTPLGEASLFIELPFGGFGSGLRLTLTRIHLPINSGKNGADLEFVPDAVAFEFHQIDL